MPRLTDEAIARGTVGLPGWERHHDALEKRYRFASFAEALAFVNRVAALAEEADHHPDILVRHREVTLTLSSHDEGGITERDLRLAAEVDR